MKYNKLLLDELRFVTYKKGATGLTDELLAKAVTLNQNLDALGYTLSPEDLAQIAVSPSLDGFYKNVVSMMDTVDADPMYPGFPQQVMEMDEAVFRFHQMLHYFSTYGLESLFGVEIKKGWLPCESETHETANKQDKVLNSKVIKLLPEEDAYIVPLRMILSRKERMTLPEAELVREAIAHVSTEEAASLRVGFKENLKTLYGIVFDLEDRDAAFTALCGLCQHTGDVLACTDVLLAKNRYHFRTSQKRFLVKLLESYPVADFKSNLVLSGKTAERNIFLLDRLDYSIYSRSPLHMDAVNALKDGKLHSWESVAKSLLSKGDAGALDFISARPGMMLRMVAWLLRLGYKAEDISAKLAEKASGLSVQTLVTNLNHFGSLTKDERADAEQLYPVFETALLSRLRCSTTPLRGKKVKLNMDEINLGMSELHCNDKSAEGGYIRSGTAYRIPENVKRLRFFVYWNDSERVDIDLHAGYTDLEGGSHSVGWNADFRDGGVVFSGDITHSNAAEYIDIDMNAPIDKVNANIHLYYGRYNFASVETCYVGMMGLGNTLPNTELYNEANCFFKHNLRQDCTTIYYGFVDVQNRCLVFDGAPDDWSSRNWYSGVEHRRGKFNLGRYLELLLEAQDVTLCDREADADAVLVMGKPLGEKDVSLVDNNYFMD